GHGPANIIFAVEPSRGEGNGAFGNDFRDEDDAPADFGAGGTPHVEAQSDFFEFGMERNWDGSEEFCAAEAKSDETYVRFSIGGIQFRAGRDVFLQAGWIHFVVQHEEVPPVGGKKYLVGVRHQNVVNRRAF